MKSKLVLLILAAAVPLSLSASPAWNIAFPQDENWDVEFSATQGEESIVEYTSGDEPANDWSQLVTVQSAPVPPREFHNVVNSFIDQLSSECGSFVESRRRDEPDSISLEWQHAGCNGFPATREYARFEYRDGMMLALRYTCYPEKIEADFDQWVNIIDSATVAR